MFLFKIVSNHYFKSKYNDYKIYLVKCDSLLGGLFFNLLRKLENSIGNGAIKVESSLEVGSTKLNL